MTDAPRKPGRPTRLTAVVGVDADGNPITVRERILTWLRSGIPYDTAVLRANISTGTMQHWLRTAAKAEERHLINPDKPLTPHEQELIEFSREVEQAQAEGEARYMTAMGLLAQGGREVKHTVEKVVVNPDGTQRVVERVTRHSTALPSFQALKWILENRYGRRAPLDVRVEQGALDEQERARELADAIETWLVHEHELAGDQQALPAPKATQNGHE